jgi:hypothetical protein
MQPQNVSLLRRLNTTTACSSSLSLSIITSISLDINQSHATAISAPDRGSALKWVKTFHYLNCKWLTDPRASLIASQRKPKGKTKIHTLCDVG